jgi:hypothetical protein
MIDWQHPTVGRQAVASGTGTSAAPRRRAFPADEVYRQLAGEDRRPLLVLRECLQCSGTEDALMSSKEDNERTYLLARWFHCIKLAPDVLEDDHPFRNLFAGEKPAHLFIANADGSARHDLEGEHSRRELWGAMEAALAANYAGDPDTALQRLTRLLGDLDDVDRSLAESETRHELAISDGASARKLKKLQDALDELRAQRTELEEAVARVSQLAPRAPAAAPTKD